MAVTTLARSSSAPELLDLQRDHRVPLLLVFAALAARVRIGRIVINDALFHALGACVEPQYAGISCCISIIIIAFEYGQ